MSVWELLIIAVGLSMDAFAVSICKGLATEKLKPRHCLIAGAWFGGFQALMPLIGYFLGAIFEKFIESFDHWVAFVLLAFLGGKMIWEALSEGEEEEADGSFGFKTMLLMAVATSIDALAAGISFGVLPDVNIAVAVTFIGLTTFLFSAVGVLIGNKFGARYQNKAELAGGIILVLIGIKILLEHLGVLAF